MPRINVLKRITNIYNNIKSILPTTYKIPKLAFFEDEESMLSNNKMKKLAHESTVYAIVNPDTLTISLPLNMSMEFIDKNGDIKNRNISINKLDDRMIANILLHELGHIYSGERYGYISKQYNDEKYCDRFAERWIKILINKGLL